MNWESEKADWPLAGVSRFRTVNGTTWHLQEMGPKEAPLLLLLHGAGASSHSFADLIPLLARRWRVVALDLPGHGFTRRAGLSRARLPQVAEDIAALMAAERLSPVAVIGHSAGGAVALELADRLPLKGIVTLNGALAEFQGVAGWLFPFLAKVLAVNPFTALFFARTATPRNVGQMIAATGSRLSPAQLRPYFRLVRDRAHVDGALTMMSVWDLRPLIARLPQIRVPVLLLTGARDKAVAPDTSARAATRLPQATHRDLPALGHLMHEEDPDAVLAEIEPWLAELGLLAQPSTQLA